MGETGDGSVCLALPLKAATAAMTLFGFLVATGSGAIGFSWISFPLVSVLARPRVGLARASLVGELSRCRLSLPFVSDRGTRSPLFLRERVSNKDAVEVVLGTTMDLGRSLAADRFWDGPWSLRGTLVVVVAWARELNSAQIGVGGGPYEAVPLGGAVFSLSLRPLTGDSWRSLDRLLPNMAARLVEDLAFLGLLAAASALRGRLASDGSWLSLGWSAQAARDRSDAELGVFLCKPLWGVAHVPSCGGLWPFEEIIDLSTAADLWRRWPGAVVGVCVGIAWSCMAIKN